MTDFRAWYLGHRPYFQSWLAQRMGTTTDYLRFLAYGGRKPGTQFKLLLEVVTGERFVFQAEVQNSLSNERADDDVHDVGS